jgi:transcriptional regulator with XRE-family HTH domain
MDIGHAIRFLRETKCLNQMDYASKVGITQGYLSQIERGHKKPSMELMEHMAEDLNMPLPVMFWFGVEESDIHESKREAYKMLKPSIDALIGSIV